MKVGKTLDELEHEIVRQAESKKDYLVPTKAMRMIAPAGDESQYKVDFGKGELPLNEVAMEQIGEHVGIPKKYLDKMRKEAPELLPTNVETWFKRFPAVRMVRTLDQRARAFLSDKFNALDNFDFAAATLPILRRRNLNIVSMELTERRLYLKAVDERLYRDIPIGYKMGDGSHQIYDTVAPALILSNSEIGFGRLVVETGVYTSACTNLSWFAKDGFKRTHVGARHQLTEGMDVADLDAIMSNTTKKKTMEALWLQVQDVVGAAFDEKIIAKRVEALEVAAGRKIEAAKIDEVIEVVSERFSFTEDERKAVFGHLVEGGALSQYGLHAAITRTAQDVESYDRATELEYRGGDILELSPHDWKELLAEAA